jgi:methylthioribose-1-phosphate isomerase
MIAPVRLESSGLVLLDQRQLPHSEQYVTLTDPTAVAEAIRSMVVRGAPAIGVAAAAGVALAARHARGESPELLRAALDDAAEVLIAARPTAVNLSWAVQRMLDVADAVLTDGGSASDAADAVDRAATALHEEDVAANRSIGSNGSLLVPDGARVLVHCNAGALATAGYGTALGVLRAAHGEGKQLSVFATETRPYLQGARLTAWELLRDGIGVTLITDGMAGALMHRGDVDLVFVGADRIARNGDVANKVGTYMLAVLARRHGIPFYVAAPVSTIDPECPDGDSIPIEERHGDEILELFGQRIAPEGVRARHIAFDVTPAALVSAIITETGVLRAPYERSIAQALGSAPGDESDPVVELEPGSEAQPGVAADEGELPSAENRAAASGDEAGDQDGLFH